MINISSYQRVVRQYGRWQKIYLADNPFDTFLVRQSMSVPIYRSNHFGEQETKIKNTHQSNYYLSII